MQKDYAKRLSYRPQKKNRRIEFLIVLIVFLIGVLGFLFYKNQATLKKIQALSFFKEETPINKSAVPTEPQVQFDFYNELPNVKVDHPSKSQNKKEEKKPPTGKFILQLGVFKDETIANQTRVSLLLLGCESEVIKIASEPRPIFEVQSIPYDTMGHAKKMQRRLQNQGLTCSIKKT